MREPDYCKNCGARPPMGLGVHPRYAVKIGLWVNGELEMVALYAHNEAELQALKTRMYEDDAVIERWNDEKQAWEDLPA